MDASILPHLLSFWTLSFPFIVSAFVHKTQSRDPPLQGNFISQSRLIRISPILDLPDTFLLPPQLSAPPTHRCRHLYYYPLQKNQLLYVHRTLFFDTAGWRLAQVQQKYSHLFYDECQHILKLLAESQWLASNPTVEIKRAQDQQEPDITFVYVFPSLALPYQVPLVLLAFGVQLLLWLSCTKPDVLSFSLLLKLH